MDEKKILMLDAKFNKNTKETEIGFHHLLVGTLSDERMNSYMDEIADVLDRMAKEINEKLDEKEQENE
ncbi:hypothetical protein QDR07_13235 [Clostridium perfringens]|uniref:hypothetical protein n=1 Tax=Clostridium perfringens TaxID=1502 RepID=UPI002449AB3C|nr:hypothetical protein [Clostridium perfringens]MDH2459474.1 hypothetical protein [Clostridium perfringens]